MISKIFYFLKWQLTSSPNNFYLFFLSLVPLILISVFNHIVINVKHLYELYYLTRTLATVGKANVVISGSLLITASYFYLRENKKIKTEKKWMLMTSSIAITLSWGWSIYALMREFIENAVEKNTSYIDTFIQIGRPLRKNGKLQLSELRGSKEWLLQRKFNVPHHKWIENAQGEHSSVSAFADLSLKLANMGCPPDLLKRAHQAAIDEINHAQLAFTLDAARNDNRAPQGPDAKRGLLGDAGHMLRVQKMAAETFTDGCLFEARSAQGLRKMVDEEPDEVIRQEIQRTVVEEDTHVELAWKILEWCFRETAQPALRARLYGQLVKILDRAEAQDSGEMGDILKNARISLEKIYTAQAA